MNMALNCRWWIQFLNTASLEAHSSDKPRVMHELQESRGKNTRSKRMEESLSVNLVSIFKWLKKSKVFQTLSLLYAVFYCQIITFKSLEQTKWKNLTKPLRSDVIQMQWVSFSCFFFYFFHICASVLTGSSFSSGLYCSQFNKKQNFKIMQLFFNN